VSHQGDGGGGRAFQPARGHVGGGLAEVAIAVRHRDHERRGSPGNTWASPATRAAAKPCVSTAPQVLNSSLPAGASTRRISRKAAGRSGKNMTPNWQANGLNTAGRAASLFEGMERGVDLRTAAPAGRDDQRPDARAHRWWPGRTVVRGRLLWWCW
jgi:hypothetical protein